MSETNREIPVHFTLLNQEEKLSKIGQFVLSDTNRVMVWPKGAKEREYYSASNFFRDKLILILRAEEKNAKLLNQDVLVNFELNGLMYFTEGEIKYDSVRSVYLLKMDGDLFRHERRSSFRLLTYPTYNVQVGFSFDGEKSEEENFQDNVIEIKPSSGNTGLFHNFLSLMNDTGQKLKKLEQEIEEEKRPPKNFNTFFRVIDLSVEGVCFIIGPIGARFFRQGNKLRSFVILFEGKEFFIPNATIVYIKEFNHPDKKTVEQHKVGIEFKHMTTKLDLELSKHINQVLREGEYEREFEKFLK